MPTWSVGGGPHRWWSRHLNPLAYWTLEDCFDYAAANGVPLHPTVALGYPSQGDEKDTVPVPDPDGLSGFQGAAGSVKFVDGKWTGDKAIWLDYGNERKGPLCGFGQQGRVHQDRVRHPRRWCGKNFRPRFVGGGAVKELASQDEALAMKDGVMVVYAPWCQFCQGMEEAYEKFAKDAAAKGITVAKYRGDEDRDFVSQNFNTE